MASTTSDTTLSVGLITAPIKLKKAKESKDVGFKMASPAGNPVKQVYIDEATGEIVGTSAECPRGIFDGDQFFPVDKDTIKAIDENGAIGGITVEGFVPLAEVPFERAESTYYIAPNSKTAGTAGRAALRLIADGLRAEGKAGIGKLSLRTKQRAFVMYEKDGALWVTTLAMGDTYTAAYAEASEYLAGEPTSEQNLKLFGTLADNLTVPVAQLDGYVDEVAPLRRDLIEKALAGETIAMPTPHAVQAPAVDLAAALEASIAATPVAKKKKAA